MSEMTLEVWPGQDKGAENPVVSIVIPMHDEQDSIGGIIEELQETWGGEDAPEYEVIVVDDGSSDDSGVRVADVAARATVTSTLVRHRRRLGKSEAIRSGVECARGKWIGTLDGDGQNDPADLLRLWHAVQKAARDGATLGIGFRSPRHDPIFKRAFSLAGNIATASLMGHARFDTTCGLTIFRRSDYQRLPAFGNMHRFLPALFLSMQGSVVSVPVVGRRRLQGHSKFGYADRLLSGCWDLVGVAWLSRRLLPF